MTRTTLLTLFTLCFAAPALAQARPDSDVGELAPPDHATWVEHDHAAGDSGGWAPADARPVHAPRRAAHARRHVHARYGISSSASSTKRP